MPATFALFDGPLTQWMIPGVAWLHAGFSFIIPVLFITLLAILIWRVARPAGGAPRGAVGAGGASGATGVGSAQTASTRSAEATLADRFAHGDIDEKEYRARLEVLRANAPIPPAQ